MTLNGVADPGATTRPVTATMNPKAASAARMSSSRVADGAVLAALRIAPLSRPSAPHSDLQVAVDILELLRPPRCPSRPAAALPSRGISAARSSSTVPNLNENDGLVVSCASLPRTSRVLAPHLRELPTLRRSMARTGPGRARRTTRAVEGNPAGPVQQHIPITTNKTRRRVNSERSGVRYIGRRAVSHG